MINKVRKSDFEYKVLKNFENNPELTQRQMALEIGLSLGKTNYIIRALLDKGLLKLNNFRKSDNKIGYLYFITPEGIARKSNLTRKFLKRKSEEYTRLESEIQELQNQSNDNDKI